jgi:hypothetical protein
VEGDTLVLRFVNSRVKTVTRVWRPYPTPNDGFAAGAMICKQNAGSTQWECAVDGETTESVSFNSEGYTVDRIAFLPEAN